MAGAVRGVMDWRRAKHFRLYGVILLSGVSAAHGQEKFETPQQTNAKIEQLAAQARSHPTNISIGSGDLLHIDVFDVPDLSRDVRVSESGEISYPLIPGKVQAAGLTPFQLEEKLEQLLIENGLVTHPQVSVFVKEQNSQPVSVVGAVTKPMVYQVFRPTTLLEVLAVAGGIADDAGSVVLVTRGAPAASVKNDPDPTGDDPPSAPRTITIKLQDLLESGDPSFNIAIYGGDVVSVPRAGIVYVAGAVQQPGGFVLQSHGDQITVLKAVALAHGLASYARPDEAVILRTNPASKQKEEIPVHLKKVMERKVADVPLKPNDLLFIPDSAGRKALAKTGEAALTITSGLVILRAGR